MSQRYELARALATMHTVPEIRGRLLAAADRMATLVGTLPSFPAEGSPAEQTSVVFDRLYGDAVVAVDAAIDAGGATSPSELVALDTMVDRVEQAVEAFARTIQSGSQALQASAGSIGPLLIGAALLGVVWWLSREPDLDF